MPKGQQTITAKRPQTQTGEKGTTTGGERESKTIKGCAWLATDDSQTGGHKEQAKSAGRVGVGRVQAARESFRRAGAALD